MQRGTTPTTKWMGTFWWTLKSRSSYEIEVFSTNSFEDNLKIRFYSKFLKIIIIFSVEKACHEYLPVSEKSNSWKIWRRRSTKNNDEFFFSNNRIRNSDFSVSSSLTGPATTKCSNVPSLVWQQNLGLHSDRFGARGLDECRQTAVQSVRSVRKRVWGNGCL